MVTVSPVIFRSGLDLKHEVAGVLADSYHSALVQQIKANDCQHDHGRLRVFLAREFGFCYGVDRAVDYAYQARRRFPDRNVFLTGEIIHNPHVNDQLRAQGIRFLTDPGEDAAAVGRNDVVILPAFGVTVEELARLSAARLHAWLTLPAGRCSTCGRTSRATRAKGSRRSFTASTGTRRRGPPPRRRFRPPVAITSWSSIARKQRWRVTTSGRRADPDPTRRAAFLERFGQAISPGFDPDTHLARIGCANQTTMLSTESVEVGEMFRAAMRERHGEAELPARFRAFDTICSATQDRQDAVVQLLAEEPIDLMLVIGGYNSSNTCNLARICAATSTRRTTSPIRTACFRRMRSAIAPWPRSEKSSRRTGCPPTSRYA